MTERGAARLQAELIRLRVGGAHAERVAELERILGSITVVDRSGVQSQSVSFGATVTMNDAAGTTETYTVVDVDELEFEPEAVSWISPIGKALLASRLGDRVSLADGRMAKIAKIE
jgi:transcription elongation GreA/GreB family factor